jgi:Bacterial dnaA protein helix-turn-helix
MRAYVDRPLLASFGAHLARRMGVAPSMLFSRTRQADVVRVRHIAMCWCVLRWHLSTPFVGRAFDRDHSTVIHALRKRQDLLDQPEVQMAVAAAAAEALEADRRSLCETTRRHGAPHLAQSVEPDLSSTIDDCELAYAAALAKQPLRQPWNDKSERPNPR